MQKMFHTHGSGGFMAVERVAILGGLRIPFTRSLGVYMGISDQDLMTFVLKEIVTKYKLTNEELGEVALGAVIKHTADYNLARECVLSSGLSARTPAYDVQQACGTSLETTILVGNKISLGQIEVGIAGGVDTNSDLPIAFSKDFAMRLLKSTKAKSVFEKLKLFLTLPPSSLKPVTPAVFEPRTGLSMGQSCEKMVKTWQISREEQDRLTLVSHQNAVKAYAEGFYNDLVVPFQNLKADTGPRADTSFEKLQKLKPVFDTSAQGTLTAGNSSPLTDGASAVLMSSESWAKKHNLPVLCYITYGQTAAVDFVEDEGLLMAPAYAVPKMLKRAGLTLQDFDFYEIHEAFAGQVLCTLKAWESAEFCKNKLGLDKPLGKIDRSKMNVKGGSVALGHPFAATGTRIVASLAKMLEQKGKGRGLISICTAGGMGVTAILERD